MTRFRHRCEYFFLRCFLLIGRGIHRSHRRTIAAILGTLAYDVFRFRRSVTLSNIRLVFGDSNRGVSAMSLGRLCYRGLAMRAIELAALTGYSREETKAACEIEGKDILDRAFARGHGVILVTAHYGNWELMAQSLATHGYPIAAVAAPMKNPWVQRWLNAMRSRYGLEIIRTGRFSARGVLRALRANGSVLLLIDQDARRHGVFVRFFGQWASTRMGAATLAQRAACPIVVVTTNPKTDSVHTIRVHGVIDPSDRNAGREELVQKIQEASGMIEDAIYENPELWFWPHRRFKTRPPEIPIQ